MKWKDSKQQVESQGIKDESVINYIEVDCYTLDSEIEVVANPNGTFYIEDK